MTTSTISTSHAASQTKWLDEVFRGGLTNNMFMNLMGTSPDSVIRVDDTKRRTGDTYVYHFDDQIGEDEWLTNPGQRSGASTAYSIATDNLTLENYFVAKNLKGFSMSQLRTSVDLQNRMKSLFADALATKQQAVIRDAILSTASGRVEQRYLYGATTANWNATHATALGNVDATNDKLTTAMISKARRKARMASNGNSKMKPAKFKLLNGREQAGYIMLAHEYAVRDLLEGDTKVDAIVKYRDKEVFNVINGADFVGEWDGVFIYKVQDDGMIVSGAGASGIDVAHNVLLGANAAVMSYGVVEMPEGTQNMVKTSDGKAVMTNEITNHGQTSEVGLTFTGGARKLVDSSSGTGQDFGVVHVFSAGVAD